MKFFRIILLSAVCFTIFSCRETLGEQHQDSQKEQTVPPRDKKENPKPPIDNGAPNGDKPELPKSSPKKQVRKQDTLKPLRASL